VATDGSDDEVALLMKEVPNLSVMRGANSDFGHPGSDDAPRSPSRLRGGADAFCSRQASTPSLSSG
jgi:hypothetical protein